MLRRSLVGVCAAALLAGVAVMSPVGPSAAAVEDSGLARYPGRDVVLRMTGGEVTDQPVKIDVTGGAEMQQRVDSIRQLLAADPERDGGLSWDQATRTVVVRLVEPAADRLAQVKSSIAAAADGLTVRYESVKYSRTELERLAHRLFSTPGVHGAGGGWDPATNRVQVLVRNDTGQSAAWARRIAALNDDRIVMRTFTPAPGPWYESRLDDAAPWKGGAWLHHSSTLGATSTNGWCTMGFVWRKWTTNVRYAGTAQHCTDEGRYTTFYNNKTFLGRAAYTSPASDSMLLGGSTYNPTVFVGSVNTTDVRKVKGVDNSWLPGDPVAFSGALSGLKVAKVVKGGYFEPCHEKWVTLMDQHVTTYGDSGGPWLTTMSGSGDVIAHGQHLGFGCAPGGRGSVFMPVNTISSYLDASIAFAP